MLNSIHRIALHTLATTIFILYSPGSSLAQYSHGGACGGAGQPAAGGWSQKNDANGVEYLLCNGTTWDRTIKFSSSGNLMAIGPYAGLSFSQPGGLIAIGGGAGSNIIGGYENVVIGVDAGVNLNGQHNLAIGNIAAPNIAGDRNIALGHTAGSNLTMGDDNILFGHGSGGGSNWSGSNNILIGNDMRAISQTSNYLNIGNTLFGNMNGAAINNTGIARIGINKNNPAVALDVIGDINYTGVIADVSDARAKTDIQPLTDALSRLVELHGVSFRMKGDSSRRVELGVIAQDVQKVYPELVTTMPDGTLTMNYQGMVGPLVEAVKELDTENDALRRMVADLSRRMDAVEGHVSSSRAISNPRPAYND